MNKVEQSEVAKSSTSQAAAMPSSQWKPIAEIAADIASGKTTATALVKQALKTIADKADFKAVIATTEARALERAKVIDEAVAAGKPVGRLAGVPFIAKDNFLAFGADTTAASNILKGFDAPYQATAIELLEAEGAICVAKANLDAFAHGSSTENSDFFTTKNPVDATRVPGGSSGGSAAVVILDMVPFALGSDTGGSIRLPASFCGAVGYKPTYGLISRYGVVAMASSLDVVGPLTRTVEDAALLLDVMAHKDGYDSTMTDREADGYVVGPDQKDVATSLKGKKIGVLKEYFAEGLDPAVKAAVEQGIATLKAAGAEIKEISIPSLPLALAVYYVVCPAEVSSNLSRYDGQRYGYTYEDAKTLDDSFEVSREKGFGAEAKRRIMIGTHVLSSGYYDAYYNKAQTVRTKLINEFAEAFKQVDFLVGPTAPVTAFEIGKNVEDPLSMYLIDIMTVAANLVGVPAVSVPCGSAHELPVGLQIMAAQKQDRALLELAAAFQRLKVEVTAHGASASGSTKTKEESNS